MKTQRKRMQWGLFASAFLVLGLLSCNKEKDTIAQITVVNDNGKNVAGALVHVFGEPSDTNLQDREVRIDREKETGKNGRATFNFTELFKKGQAGFAVLDVEITRDSLKGEGFIKVKDEETNKKTFTIE